MARFRWRAAKRAGLPLAFLLVALGGAAEPRPPRLSEAGRTFSGYASAFASLALSPDGRLALTGDEDKNVVLWDVAAGKPARVLAGHKRAVFSVAFSPDGARALSGSWDGTLRLWKIPSGELERELDARGAEVFSVAFSPDGRRALSGDRAGAVKLWDLETGALLRELKGHRANVVAAVFTSDGARAVTTDMDNRAVVWDLESGRALRTFEKRGHFVMGGYLAPDQKAFVFNARPLALVALEGGKTLREFPQAMSEDSADTTVAFSPDGTRLIVESARHRLNLWDVSAGKIERAYDAPLTMRGAAFTPDGKTLVAAFSSTAKPGVVIAWPVDSLAPASGGPESSSGKGAPATQAALGKLLFFDTRLSKDNLVSCASCHDPAKGWSDGRPVSAGVGGRKGRRNALSLLNVGRRKKLFWDGRASSLEDQVHFPVQDSSEMGTTLEESAKKVAAAAGYRALFKAAFGDEEVTAGRITSAIAAFERTLVSLDTPYDRYLKGDEGALSPSAKKGLDLFRSKARCFTCHELPTSGTVDPEFINVGLHPPAKDSDPGRYAVTKRDEDLRAFTVPDLRNLKYTAPYMHDGSLATLRDVVDFYDRGGNDDPKKAPWVAPLRLSEDEKRALLDFLGSLDGDPLALAPPKELPR